MTINVSTLSSGGGGGFKLAPDLTWPSARNAGTPTKRITGLNLSAGLTTVLSLTPAAGTKLMIDLVAVNNLDTTAGATTTELVVDGVTIWNAASYTEVSNTTFVGGTASNGTDIDQPFIVEQSFVLRMQNPATSASCTFRARPIL